MLGGATAWPLVAFAQQGSDRMHRIGLLMPYDEADPEAKTYLSEFVRGLAELGWTDGRNVRIDMRWAAGNVERIRRFAKELTELQPDVILSPTTAVTAAFQRETRTIPIIFASVSDPVGSGFVAGLPRPGGNLTGFIYAEATMAGKWLALLREITNGVKHAAMMFNPDTAPGDGSYYYLPAFEATARSLNVNPIAAPVRGDREIETAIASLAREPQSGLIVMGDSFTVVHRANIISLAARNNLPAIYSASLFVRDGGLLSYGPDRADIFHRSATHIDRILRGAKPAELPVEVPIKFEMAINLATAKSLSLTIPETLLATADEVVQ